MKWLITS